MRIRVSFVECAYPDLRESKRFTVDSSIEKDDSQLVISTYVLWKFKTIYVRK